MLKLAFAPAFTLACLFGAARADDAPVPVPTPTPPAPTATPAPTRCADMSVIRDPILAHDGKWIELTSEQWQFLRGVFVLNPNTPPGLPYGDKAALMQIHGDSGGMIFFIDGDRACDGMAAPAILVNMMNDVGSGTITHEGNGL